ncbi:MAG: DUF1800 domain-containing protein [Halioglobus sp.]
MDTTPSKGNKFKLPEDVHFLNRISYGPTPETVALVANMGWDAVLENQLHPESIDTSVIDNALILEQPVLAFSPKDIAESNDPEIVSKAVSGFVGASLIRQLYSPAQLYERMVEFWSDHFNMNILDGRVYVFKASDDKEAIRPNALGKFRDLLHANARSPAMLLYLDNYSNTKFGPNENYARELLELHTLGVDGGYTEADVVAVARAFTGWTIDEETLEFTFRPGLHDSGKKRVLGQKIKTVQNGGIGDGEQVLDLLAIHPSTAHFISTKLARRFVSDNPPEALVADMAEVFLETDGDIKALLHTLFHSDEFWASTELKMKRPVDLMTSVYRRLGLTQDDNTSNYLRYKLDQMGQIPFLWETPDGYPDTAEYWTNTAALVNRWNVAKDAAYFLPRGRYLEMLDGANTVNGIIQAMSIALIDRKLKKNELRKIRKNIYPSKLPNKPIKGNLIPSARTVAIALLSSRYFQMR